MAHRNRVRRHRPDRRPCPPRPVGDLAPRPLVHRGAFALGKRRDVRGRPEPSTHRQRSTGDGHAAEPRHQPAPPGRRHQHRQSPTASRTGHQVPDHTAADQLKCRRHTAPRTLPTPWGIAFDGSGIWVTNYRSFTVSRIDPNANAVTDTVGVGSFPRGVAFDGTNLWVANSGSPTITREPPPGTVSKLLP